jgi:hypothetical protein
VESSDLQADRVCAPHTLVPIDLPLRQEVVDYPTDFAAMSDETIELLAGRGEKLTRLLLDFYCPEL